MGSWWNTRLVKVLAGELGDSDGANGFKGIVYPKLKILSLITHPHVVTNP